MKNEKWTFLDALPQIPVFAQRRLKDATLTIAGTSGTGSPMNIKIGEGNLTWTENRTIEYTLDRGHIDEVREGNDVPVSVSFQFMWIYVANFSDITMENAIKGPDRSSPSCDWTSSDADTCRPYAVDLIFDFDPDCVGSGVSETITFSDFRWEQLEHDSKAGTISCSGKCNILFPTRAAD